MGFFKKKQDAQLQVEMTVEDVMKKYDRESNTRVWEGVPKIIVNSILALFSLFCMYVILLAKWTDEVRLTSFVAFIVFIGFLVFPAKKGVQKVNHMPWYDIIIMLLGTGAFVYLIPNLVDISLAGCKLDTYQIIIGVIGILALAELCRRSVGLPILIVAAAIIIYALVGGGAMGPLTLERRVEKTIYEIFYCKNGILTTPINVCSRFIVAFIIFGAFLERTGIGEFFIKIANAFVGGFSGGPAKVAVVASALEGMVSGSSVANTVGSGSVTIPLMKKTGYKPEFAAAAEASASTGGQIMPPIMGAAAFLMAEQLGTSYSNIVVKAILPAILYFTGVFIAVHLEAKKEGLRGLTREELPRLKPLLKQTYLLLPLIILIYLVGTSKRTIAYAAVIAIIAVIIVSLFNKENRLTPKKLWEALATGGQSMIAVAVACGIAGIISGIIGMTGLAMTMLNSIVSLAGDKVIVALVLTMLCCIVLGMGVPTTANYCIMAATCAPILINMEVPPIAAHFFVFYFGIVADLTPPVALAAYAGAAIAHANPMKTAITATKLAIGAFVVPYIFALNPAMLFVNTTALEVVQIVITSLIGIFAVSAALEGYFLSHMKWYERIMSLAGGLMLLYPGLVTDLVGVGLVVIMTILQIIGRKSTKEVIQTS